MCQHKARKELEHAQYQQDVVLKSPIEQLQQKVQSIRNQSALNTDMGDFYNTRMTNQCVGSHSLCIRPTKWRYLEQCNRLLTSSAGHCPYTTLSKLSIMRVIHRCAVSCSYTIDVMIDEAKLNDCTASH